MSEAGAAAPSAAGTPTAGRLLREARERQGLHIAALAASIKVPPKKLEMLEADRFDALPDATFTRALAQTVCRALKIDPGAVLRLLPPPVGHRLEHVAEGLNAPFRDRSGALVKRDWAGFAASPAFWITALILAAAVAVYFLPSGLIKLLSPRTTVVPATVTTVTATVPLPSSPTRPGETPGMPPDTPAETTSPGAPVAIGADAASAVASPVAGVVAVPAGLLQVRTSAPSWVEVSDARNQTLIARLMQPGESVGLDGAPPLRVRIGNASATQITFRGRPAELAAFTRDNVARLDLR